MSFSSWIERNHDKFGSEYEVIFASNVLPLVDGLTCEAVSIQYHFLDSDGKDRYCDFTIIESETVRVAIEIDGYDKRGTGTGMSYGDFLDWQRRQASLASQGWHVLRFANRDVRDEPARCAEHISRLLNRLRQTQTGRVQIFTIAHKPLEIIVTPAKADDREAQAPAPKRNNKLLHYFVGVVLVIGLSLWLKGNGKHESLIEHPASAIDSSVNSSLSRYGSTETHRSESFPERTLATASSIAQAAPSINTLRANKHPYGTLNCNTPLDWSSTKKHIGKVVTVVGPLIATKPRPDVSGSPMWLDVGAQFPSQKRLTIVLWGKNWPKFDTSRLDAEYWLGTDANDAQYASICIRGKVSEYKGVPQIELEDLRQLKIGFNPT